LTLAIVRRERTGYIGFDKSRGGGSDQTRRTVKSKARSTNRGGVLLPSTRSSAGGPRPTRGNGGIYTSSIGKTEKPSTALFVEDNESGGWCAKKRISGLMPRGAHKLEFRKKKRVRRKERIQWGPHDGEFPNLEGTDGVKLTCPGKGLEEGEENYIGRPKGGLCPGHGSGEGSRKENRIAPRRGRIVQSQATKRRQNYTSVKQNGTLAHGLKATLNVCTVSLPGRGNE